MAINPTVGTRTSLTCTGLSTLASGTYVASNNYNCNTNKPVDVIIDVALATTNTPSGNKQANVFIIESLDGTNYRSGPTSGTTTTDEPDLKLIGVIFLYTATNTHEGTFSLKQALGYIPYGFKVVIKNDLGVALTSGSINTSEITIS